MNSPYQDLINTRFLVYREVGWFTELWDTWYSSSGGCGLRVGPTFRSFAKLLSQDYVTDNLKFMI